MRNGSAQNGVMGVETSLLTTHSRIMWDEGVIRAVARTQHGLIARGELLAMGVTDHEIVRRVGNGRLEQPHPGVYYLNCTPATWRTEVLAAVVAAGPDALASHRTAAVLWEFDAIYRGTIEVTVPFNEEPDPEGVIVHRTRRINPGMIHDSIPITSPEKALLDVTPLVPERVLEKAMRAAIRNGLTTPEKLDLAVRINGGRGVAGTRRFRRVIHIVAADNSGSVAEIDLKHIVMDAPIPAPIQQLRVRLHGGGNAYPDFAWPDRMRIVEVDGFEAHGTPEQLQHDLRRQNQLMDLGWEIRRFTATEIRDQPLRVRAEVVRFINKPFCAD